MLYRNKAQNSRLHALLGKLNLDKESKEDLVFQFTKGRETSSARMSVPECQAMINHLNAFAQGAARNLPPDPADKMRKKILSMCREMGEPWMVAGGYNWRRINGWLMKFGYLHKPLNKYSVKELPRLVSQFEEVLKNHYAAR